MTQSIYYRKKSFLASYEWCTKPWSTKPRNALQRLCDHGFAIGAMFEEMDTGMVTADFNSLNHFIRRLSALDAALNIWYSELQRTAKSPLYWSDPSCGDDTNAQQPQRPQSYDSHDDIKKPFSFGSLHDANLLITYWALKLALSFAISVTCSIILNTTLAPGLEQTAERLCVIHGREGRVANAVNIMRSMEYCLDDKMGSIGGQKAMFAMRVASLSISQNKDSRSREIGVCMGIYERLYREKGLAYAKALSEQHPEIQLVLAIQQGLGVKDIRVCEIPASPFPSFGRIDERIAFVWKLSMERWAADDLFVV